MDVGTDQDGLQIHHGKRTEEVAPAASGLIHVRLREALVDRHEGGQGGPAGGRPALLRSETAGAAFVLGDVADLILSGEVAFEQLDQIVGEAEEVRACICWARAVFFQ